MALSWLNVVPVRLAVPPPTNTPPPCRRLARAGRRRRPRDHHVGQRQRARVIQNPAASRRTLVGRRAQCAIVPGRAASYLQVLEHHLHPGPTRWNTRSPSAVASMIVAPEPDEPAPLMISTWLVLVMSSSPVCDEKILTRAVGVGQGQRCRCPT